MKAIPEVGKEYYFFDDGKTSPSRCYKAKVIRVIPYDEEVLVDTFNYDINETIPTPIQVVHQWEVDDHRQSESIIVCNSRGAKSTPGAPWLYAEETDFFVECEIPGYDKNTIWFARTIDGGWFSMDIQSSWQSGTLDIDNSIYEDARKYFGESHKNMNYYDDCLIQKGEYIKRF